MERRAVTVKHEVLSEVFLREAVAPAPWDHRVLEEEISSGPARDYKQSGNVRGQRKTHEAALDA